MRYTYSNLEFQFFPGRTAEPPLSGRGREGKTGEGEMGMEGKKGGRGNGRER